MILQSGCNNLIVYFLDRKWIKDEFYVYTEKNSGKLKRLLLAFVYCNITASYNWGLLIVIADIETLYA